MLRSYLCNYIDGYIVVEEKITVIGTADANKQTKN